MRSLLSTLVLLAPLAAAAAPPHAIVEVKPGDTTFVRLYDVSALASADPSIATVEHLPSDELLVSGKRAGTTELVAIAAGKILGVRVHVRAPGSPLPSDGQKELEAALKACPQHQHVGEDKSPGEQLGAAPTTPACRAALVALFATDRFTVKQVAVNFDQSSLQAQIAEMDQAVKAAGLSQVAMHYQGATLVLKGTVTPAEAGKLIVAVYAHAIGGIPIDADELEITLPDGGAVGDPPPTEIMRIPPPPVR